MKDVYNVSHLKERQQESKNIKYNLTSLRRHTFKFQFRTSSFKTKGCFYCMVL